MDRRNPTAREAAVAALYTAANRCEDPRLRGAMLAFASLHDGGGFDEVVRLWGVDPGMLRDVRRRFEEGGIAALSPDAGHGPGAGRP